MKKICLYISFSCFFVSLSFADQKSAGTHSSSMGAAAISFDQPSLVGGDEDAVERRKRAHKRKRQIRPRRNGF